MSSSGGLSSYSPLFASGLHQTVREQAVESHFPRNKGPSRAQQYPSNVPSRRPSGADTYAESTYSRRSSMPTFYSGSSDYRQDRSRAANYPVPSPGISFTPSVLFRADTIVTKRSGNPPQRSNFQSFLSLDVNDPIQHAPPSLNSTQARFIAISRSNDSRKQARPVSVNSSLWALPLHSPYVTAFSAYTPLFTHFSVVHLNFITLLLKKRPFWNLNCVTMNFKLCL